MKNMSAGSLQDVERNGVDSTKLEQVTCWREDSRKNTGTDKKVFCLTDPLFFPLFLSFFSATPLQVMSVMSTVNRTQKADRTGVAGPTEGEKGVLAKQDLELVLAELELSQAVAEKHMKEHEGDVVRTLAAPVAAA